MKRAKYSIITTFMNSFYECVYEMSAHVYMEYTYFMDDLATLTSSTSKTEAIVYS